MICQQVTLVGDAEWPKVADAVIEALERGVRRNGQLIASDIQGHIEQIRTIAQQEGLSQHCMERSEKAERVVPKMQATIEFVSGYVDGRWRTSIERRPSPASCTPSSSHRIISIASPRLEASAMANRFASSLEP